MRSEPDNRNSVELRALPFAQVFRELCLPVPVEVLVHRVTLDLIFDVILGELDSNLATVRARSACLAQQMRSRF